MRQPLVFLKWHRWSWKTGGLRAALAKSTKRRQSGGNDTCTVSYSAAVQTQIIGMSGGGHVRDLNCERLKNAKALYNMGMKVAAVSLMCQEESIFKAMEMAGTPCPFRGEIGATAQALWENDPESKPQPQKEQPNDTQNFAIIGGIVLLLLTGI